jgi:hypothetical protein
MNTRNLLAFGLIALLGAACGGSKSSTTTPGGGGGGTTKAFSCNFGTGGICLSITGIPSATDLTASTNACTSGNGTPGTACPTASRVGCCAMPKTNAADPQQSYCYYGPTFTATTASADCAAPPAGSWTPG